VGARVVGGALASLCFCEQHLHHGLSWECPQHGRVFVLRMRGRLLAIAAPSIAQALARAARQTGYWFVAAPSTEVLLDRLHQRYGHRVHIPTIHGGKHWTDHDQALSSAVGGLVVSHEPERHVWTLRDIARFLREHQQHRSDRCCPTCGQLRRRWPKTAWHPWHPYDPDSSFADSFRGSDWHACRPQKTRGAEFRGVELGRRRLEVWSMAFCSRACRRTFAWEHLNHQRARRMLTMVRRTLRRCGRVLECE
jgi:hypothetical protein